MSSLTPNYIKEKFSLAGTNTIVLLNGIYQPQLSYVNNNIKFTGTTLEIPKNSNNEKPLRLLFLTEQSCHNNFTIIANENSYTTIIEEHASLGEQFYTSEFKINIEAKPHSKITHYLVQTLNSSVANHQASITIEQANDSKVVSNFFNQGAKTMNGFLQVKLAGINASFAIKGINFLKDKQEMSNHIRIEHLKPHCQSNVLIKSIVDDQATTNFDCRVVTYQQADKTQTHVTNKNLLLSEQAAANTAPELEVYADDVICTHGATVGQLDQEAMFYLRSRGIAEKLATKMLVTAFVNEITEQFAQFARYQTALGLIYD